MSKWYDDLDHRCQFCTPAIDRIREIDGALDKVRNAVEDPSDPSSYVDYEELDNEAVRALRADKTRNLLYFSACNQFLCGVTSEEGFALPPAYGDGEYLEVFRTFTFTAACPDCQWIADAIAAVKSDRVLLSATGESFAAGALLAELSSEQQQTWLSIALQMLWEALADCYQTHCPGESPFKDGPSLAAAFETPDLPDVTELAEPAAADGGSPPPINDIPAHVPQQPSGSPGAESTAQYNEDYLDELFTALEEAGPPEMSVVLDEDGNLTEELPAGEQLPTGTSAPVDLPEAPPRYQTWTVSEALAHEAFGVAESAYHGREIFISVKTDGERTMTGYTLALRMDGETVRIPVPSRFWIDRPDTQRSMNDPAWRFDEQFIYVDFEALGEWLGLRDVPTSDELWEDRIALEVGGVAFGRTPDGIEASPTIDVPFTGISVGATGRRESAPTPPPVDDTARSFFSGRWLIAGAILILLLGAAIGFSVFGGGDDTSEVPAGTAAGGEPPATATSSVGGGLPADDATSEATPATEAPVVATVVAPVGEGCGDIDTAVYEPFPATGFGIPGAAPLNEQVSYAVVDGGVRICLEIPPEADHEAVIARGGYFLATLSLTVDNLLVELSVFTPGATAAPGRVIQRVGATEEGTFDLTDSEVRGDAAVIFVPARREGGNLVFDLGGATYGTLSFIGLAAGSFSAGDPTPLWSGAVSGDVAVFEAALNWP